MASRTLKPARTNPIETMHPLKETLRDALIVSGYPRSVDGNSTIMPERLGAVTQDQSRQAPTNNLAAQRFRSGDFPA
jgi:hypothetical protein